MPKSVAAFGEVMPKSVAAFGAALVAIGLSVGTVSAWDRTTHQIVALIAYRTLTEEMKSTAEIHALLKHHPHYAEFLSKNKLPGVSLDEWVVMRAGYWPDWIKDGHPEMVRETWHYVNFPLVAAAPGDTALQAKVEDAFSDRKKNHGDFFLALSESRRKVRDKTLPASERAVRLCWVVHLIGDLHQALHSTALCTAEFPDGDNGGNKYFVRRKGSGLPVSLHSLWDNMLDGGGSADEEFLARTIMTDYPVTAEQRAVKDSVIWAEESYEIAKKFAYMPGGALIELRSDKSQAKELPDGYEANALEVCKKRVRLAGVRLADVLAEDLK